MESFSDDSTKPLSNSDSDRPICGAENLKKLKECSIGNPGNQEVKDCHLSSSTMFAAGEANRSFGDDWGCGPILFPYPDGDSYETSNDRQSPSVPPPPLYVPRPSWGTDIWGRDIYVEYEIEPIPMIVNEGRDIWGREIFVQQQEIELIPFDANDKFKQEIASEAIKWFNNEKGRKFELVKLVDVASFFIVTCFVLDLTIEAVDADAPNDPPSTFEARYFWKTMDKKDGVHFCHLVEKKCGQGHKK